MRGSLLYAILAKPLGRIDRAIALFVAYLAIVRDSIRTTRIGLAMMHEVQGALAV